MTFIEWANVVLPLLALGWGVCLVALYPEAIDRWAAQFDTWWIDTVGERRRKS